MTTLFQTLGLRPEILKAIEALGFEEPSPIQTQAIPALMNGADIVAQAPTGTGKTAAFAIPIMERINPAERTVQAIVLVPTRELAVQVAEASHAIGRFCRANVLPVYGGQAYEHQLRGLRAGAHLVVGTPGRVMDHIRRGTLQLATVRFVVLDEADEMLDMGFIDDIQLILDQTPPGRQMALFSATIPPRIQSLARRYMKDPQTIALAHEAKEVPLTHQVYYETQARTKRDALTNILDEHAPHSAIIFCRTRSEAGDLASALQARGYGAEAIHGDMSQAQRERVLGKFRANKVTLLVATDVAARGLDIPDVSHVINFDIPDDADAYVHRIGRTGRMGRKGEAITLVTPRELRLLHIIEKDIHRKMKRLELPTPQDIAARRTTSFMDALRDTLRGGAAQPYGLVAVELAEEFSPMQIAASAIQMAFEATGASLIPAPQASGGRGPEGATTRLMLDAGRRLGVRPGDIVKSIATDAGIPGSAIGNIEVQADLTYIEVQSAAVKNVLERAAVVSFRGGQAQLTLAQPQASAPEPAAAARPNFEPGAKRSTPRPNAAPNGFGGSSRPYGKPKSDGAERPAHREPAVFRGGRTAAKPKAYGDGARPKAYGGGARPAAKPKMHGGNARPSAAKHKR